MTTTIQTATFPQGGDLRGLPAGRRYLDVSTCANRYGPPPAVRTALARVDVRRLIPHPYEAEQMFVSAYAGYLGVPEHQLVPGRGITEFIRLFGALLPPGSACVITPDYTDTVRTFHNHLGRSDGGVDDVPTRLARVADGMDRFSHVILSNPNNPLGLHIPPTDLAAVCRAYPASTLIVDEAYVDFTAAGIPNSMIWQGLNNVVVLMSPNKLFGIAGTRTGVMWCPDAGVRERVNRLRLNWSLSYLDAVLASAALGSTAWARDTTSRLLNTASRMEALLVRRFPHVVTGVGVHYRFVATDDAVAVRERLVEAGVVARAFASQDRRPFGLRITAPTDEEFELLADALAE